MSAKEDGRGSASVSQSGAASIIISDKERQALEEERDRILHDGPAPDKKGISCKEICIACFGLCLFGTFAFLTYKGYVQEAAIWAGELGPPGHLIFIALYIFVAMPFGWGYSVVIVAGGFVFGFAAIATAEVGTLVGSFLSYLLCKKSMADWVRTKLKGMKPGTQKTLLAIELAIRQGKGGIGMQTGLRVNPVLPYGWTNAVLGVWEVAPSSFLLSTMMGCQIDIILKTNVGVIFKTAGSLDEQTPESKKLIQTQLYIQCSVFVVVLVVGCLYSRWIMKNVMPQDDAGMIEPEKDNLTIEAGAAEVVMQEAADCSGEQQVRNISSMMNAGGAKNRQGWRAFVTVLFRTRGSVIIKAIPISAFSAVLAFILVLWRTRDPDAKILPELRHPFTVQIFGIILSFVIVARTNVALDRYFDGVKHVHIMSSRWIDAFTSLLGFLRSSYDLHPDDSPKKEACIGLGLAMLHWATLAHAIAINSLQCTQLGIDEAIWEPRLAVLAPPVQAALDKRDSCFSSSRSTNQAAAASSPEAPQTDRKTRSRGSMMKGAMLAERRISLTAMEDDGEGGKVAQQTTQDRSRRDLTKLGVYGQPSQAEVMSLHGATDKVAIILMWMEEAISRGQVQSILLTAPPILGRVYNEVGAGLEGFNNAYRIALVPFPFCFAQMISWCLVIFLFLCPAVAFVFTGGEILTSSLTFCCLMGFWGLNRIAMELENPFGCAVNHLPMAELHHAYVEAIGEMHDNPMPEYHWQTIAGVVLGGVKRNMLE